MKLHSSHDDESEMVLDAAPALIINKPSRRPLIRAEDRDDDADTDGDTDTDTVKDADDAGDGSPTERSSNCAKIYEPLD